MLVDFRVYGLKLLPGHGAEVQTGHAFVLQTSNSDSISAKQFPTIPSLGSKYRVLMRLPPPHETLHSSVLHLPHSHWLASKFGTVNKHSS